MSLITALLVVATSGAFSLAADVSVRNSGINLRVLGHSGKMELSNNDTTVRVQMKGLQEVSADGEPVGHTLPNKDKHSFNSFASQDFTISPISSKGLNSAVGSKSVDFTCPLLDGSALFKVTAHLVLNSSAQFSEPGSNETFVLSAGSLKFNVDISNWSFCTPGGTGHAGCKGENGAFLDVSFIVTDQSAGSGPGPVPGNGTAPSDNVADVLLSGGGAMQLAEMAQLDGAWTRLPPGYPRVETSGATTTITLRFPRFTTTVHYDPVVQLTTGGGGSDGGGSGRNGAIIGVAIAAAVCVGAIAFIVMKRQRRARQSQHAGRVDLATNEQASASYCGTCRSNTCVHVMQ